MKGGKLCDKHNDTTGGDIYTLGDMVFPGIYVDKNDPNILIKIIKSKKEYEIAKYLAFTEFVPKVYGYFDCTNSETVEKYSTAQQRIKAQNAFNPNNIKDVGPPTYVINDKIVLYMVMERIDGESLANVSNDILSKYIDEIYRQYNILADKGVILNDLALRNVILSKEGKIYLIDFDPHYTTVTHSSIPINRRFSKEAFKDMLPSGPAMYFEDQKYEKRVQSRIEANKNKLKKGGTKRHAKRNKRKTIKRTYKNNIN